MSPSTSRTTTARVVGGLAGLAAVTLFAAACGGGTGGSAYPQAGAAGGGGYEAAAPGTTAAGAVLTSRQVPLGTVLADAAGRSVYLFEKDMGTTSACTGACAQAWPPVLTTAGPTAGTGVTASLIGTTRRGDGTVQVTYAGHPLYRFSGDSAPGQTNGEGLQAFGGGWYVLTPQGGQIDNG
jgi:predicted lipoprotein with Yx(FWY)xxD motif